MQLIYARTSHLIIRVGEASGDSDMGDGDGEAGGWGIERG